jgi:hypothetical protein
MCSEPQKVHFAQEWAVLSGRSCWDAFFLRFEPLYHTSEHMRCMVWVESAVVTPAQGPQAANTVKVAKYYVGEG